MTDPRLSFAELIDLASPPCGEDGCEQPVQRVEYTHRRVGVDWQIKGAIAVCKAGHRVPVQPIERAK